MTHSINNEDSNDILTQAMASIKTPVKRRITPMTLSTTVEGVVFQGSQDKPSTVINDNKSHQVSERCCMYMFIMMVVLYIFNTRTHNIKQVYRLCSPGNTS